MSNIIIPSLTQLMCQSPVLLVYLVGLILALVFWRRHPGSCLLTLIATSLLLVLAVTQTLATQCLFQARFEMDWSEEKLGWMVSAVALTSSFLRAIALGCLLAAVFIGRRVAQRPGPDQPPQPTRQA